MPTWFESKPWPLKIVDVCAALDELDVQLFSQQDRWSNAFDTIEIYEMVNETSRYASMLLDLMRIQTDRPAPPQSLLSATKDAYEAMSNLRHVFPYEGSVNKTQLAEAIKTYRASTVILRAEFNAVRKKRIKITTNRR
jgi:hypothetical protein